MTNTQSIARYVVLRPNLSAAAYIALMITALLIVTLSLMDIAEHYGARNSAAARLANLEQRASFTSSRMSAHTAPAGSPFLDGQTATIASAALLQRITSAITRTGGNVVSSEVDAPNAQPKDGYVKVVVNCELAERSLQQLLYEIEAGAPFLFIDQLAAQAPTSSGGPMRVMLAVSGQWAGAK